MYRRPSYVTRVDGRFVQKERSVTTKTNTEAGARVAIVAGGSGCMGRVSAERLYSGADVVVEHQRPCTGRWPARSTASRSAGPLNYTSGCNGTGMVRRRPERAPLTAIPSLFRISFTVVLEIPSLFATPHWHSFSTSERRITPGAWRPSGSQAPTRSEPTTTPAKRSWIRRPDDRLKYTNFYSIKTRR